MLIYEKNLFKYARNTILNIFFTDNATTVHCELYIRSFGSISPVTMVSVFQTKCKYNVSDSEIIFW